MVNLPSEPDISTRTEAPSCDSKAKEGEAEGSTMCGRRSRRTDAVSADFRYAPLKLGLSHLGPTLCTMARHDVNYC